MNNPNNNPENERDPKDLERKPDFSNQEKQPEVPLPNAAGTEASEKNPKMKSEEDVPVKKIPVFKNWSDSFKSDRKSEPKEEAVSDSTRADLIPAGKGPDWLHQTKTWQISSGCLLLLALVLVFSSSSKSTQLTKANTQLDGANEKVTALTKEKNQLTDDKSSLESEVESLKAQIEELENGSKVQLAGIKTAFENGEWAKVVELYEPMHQKYNGTEEDKQATDLKNQAQQKIDEAEAAKKAKEEEEARKKAEEEARGYETGITYDQLARTPDEFEGKKVKFSGKVIQVSEGLFPIPSVLLWMVTTIMSFTAPIPSLS